MLRHINGGTPNIVSRSKKRKANNKKSDNRKTDGEDKSKKPSNPERSKDGVSRVQKRDNKDVTSSMKPKEEANIKRRKTGSHKDVPITLSDSEDDTPLQNWHSRLLQSETQWSFDNVEDVKPSKETLEANFPPTFNNNKSAIIALGDETLSKGCNKTQTQSELEDQTLRANKLLEDLKAQTAATIKAQDDIETQRTRVNDLRTEAERLKCAHAIELRRVRQEEVDQKMLEVEVEHRKKALETAKELLQVKEERDELKRTLNIEKTRTISSEETRDGLKSELETEKQKCVALDVKIEALQAENTTLTKDLEKESKEHFESREIVAKLSLVADELASLKTVNDELNKEVESLRADAIEQAAHFPTPYTLSSTPSALSPTPSPTTSTHSVAPSTHTSKPTIASFCSSSEDTKMENVRKTYISVKMRYDSLYSVAKQLSVSTRGMPLTNFGEFGAYLRQLNTAISDVDGATAQGGDSQRKKDSFYSDSTTNSP